MSAEYKGQDPLDIVKQAERDLNSPSAKQGRRGGSDSSKFPSPSTANLLQSCCSYYFPTHSLVLLLLPKPHHSPTTQHFTLPAKK